MLKVSIIIPLYNKENHISRALKSVFSQTYQDYEIIVVDDGSTDKSAEIVKNLKDQRIKLIQQQNLGVSAARNRGIKEASGNLIAFLDADDEWTSSFLETINRLKEKYPSAGIYATAYLFCNENLDFKLANYREIPPAPWEGVLNRYFLSAAKGDHPVCSSAVCIPKDVFIKVKGFKEDFWWGEDDDLWGRIALNYPVVFSWQIGAIYHRESENRVCNRMLAVEHPFVKEAELFIQKGYAQNYIMNDLRECIAHYKLLSAIQNLYAGYSELSKNQLKTCETNELLKQKFFWYILSLLPSKSFMLIVAIKRKATKLVVKKNKYLKVFHIKHETTIKCPGHKYD